MASLRFLRTAGAVALVVSLVVAGPAPARAAGPDLVSISGTAQGVSVRLPFLAGRQTLFGRWDGHSDRLGAVHGWYTGAITVTDTEHAPGCLETTGSVTFFVQDQHGHSLGRVDAPLDGGDSEVCARTAGSRTYFLRADVAGGSGRFADATGNWLLTGSGTKVRGLSRMYHDTLSVSGDLAL